MVSPRFFVSEPPTLSMRTPHRCPLGLDRFRPTIQAQSAPFDHVTSDASRWTGCTSFSAERNVQPCRRLSVLRKPSANIAIQSDSSPGSESNWRPLPTTALESLGDFAWMGRFVQPFCSEYSGLRTSINPPWYPGIFSVCRDYFIGKPEPRILIRAGLRPDSGTSRRQFLQFGTWAGNHW